jgi:predicted nucleotidyltransferase
MFSLDGRLLFLTLAGSHAHGTAGEGSDLDLRGVCVAPLELRLSLFDAFEQYEGSLPEELTDMVARSVAAHPSASRAPATKTECVVFDIAKFLRLCAAANPNALEILFTDERDHVYVAPAFERLRRERRRFLTVELKETFLRYALSQLRRIKSHRSRLVRGHAEPANVRRNPARAELERRFGYDTKHAMHLVRLLRMGLEALERGELVVPRSDAAELRAIRDGELSFERLLELASELEQAMFRASEATALPEAVDRAWVDEVARSFMLAEARERAEFPAGSLRKV